MQAAVGGGVQQDQEEVGAQPEAASRRGDRHERFGNPLGDTTATRGYETTPATSYVRPSTAAHPATRRTPPWRTFVLVAGHPVGVRQLEPTDAPSLMDALRDLSPASRRHRFLATIREYTPDRVDALTAAGRPGRYALIAALLDHPRRPIIAVAEFVTTPNNPWIAEPAIAVLDPYQVHRLGTRLWHTLLDAAQQHGVTHLTATLDAANTVATRLLQRAGAQLALDTPGVLRADLDIPPPHPAATPAQHTLYPGHPLRPGPDANPSHAVRALKRSREVVLVKSRIRRSWWTTISLVDSRRRAW